MMHEPDSSRNSEIGSRVIRCLLYAHCLAAVLTSSMAIGMTLGVSASTLFVLEGMSGIAFLLSLLFPPLVLASAVIWRIPHQQFSMDALVIFALIAFQFYALLPAYQ